MCNYIITDFPAFVKSKAERIISETRIDVKWVCFISVEARLRKFSAENSKGKSDLKSPQKPLGRAPLKLPKSCLTHLKHTHVKWAQFWGGYDLTFERVETAAAMKAALGQQTWDVVISDYSMPHFSGLAALTLKNVHPV